MKKLTKKALLIILIFSITNLMFTPVNANNITTSLDKDNNKITQVEPRVEPGFSDGWFCFCPWIYTWYCTCTYTDLPGSN